MSSGWYNGPLPVDDGLGIGWWSMSDLDASASNQIDEAEDGKPMPEAEEDQVVSEIELELLQQDEDDEENDFDDEMVFALSPETCPEPPPPSLPVPKPSVKTELRIFVGTWNMAAQDPFAVRPRGRYIGDEPAASALRDFLPLGYDIYVLGTQEKVTKHLHAAVLARLNQQLLLDSEAQTFQRLELTPSRQRAGNQDHDARHGSFQASSDSFSSWTASSVRPTSIYSLDDESESVKGGSSPQVLQFPIRKEEERCSDGFRWRKKREFEEIRGHGDHALLWRKSTGLAVYHASRLQGRLEVVATGAHRFSGSKGGVAVTIRMVGDTQTLTFANCHLEANRIARRRQQLDVLAQQLPLQLCTEPVSGGASSDQKPSLATCSDHVIWMGDFNYRVQSLDGDDVLRLLSSGRLRELHEHYDSMAADLEHVPGLQSFREPTKWPTFYPTYKKVANRARLPLSGSCTSTGQDTRWAQHVYLTKYREPFYKGGRCRERVPGWCDRILYCSRPQGPWQDRLKVEQATCSDANRGASSFSPEAEVLTVSCATAAVFLSLVSVGTAFYAMVYPAWFQQHYTRDGNDVYQSYGLFAFYSTGSLESPFYASVTVLQYSDFCVDDYTTPNYMLGDGADFHEVLCGKRMMSVQATTATGAAVSVVGLLTAIGAVFNPSAGYAERVVSFCTLAGSLLLAVSLVIWGALLQQTLYQIDTVNAAYTSCKSDNTDWHCWFYGYSFWVCLASVIVLSIAGYLSSAGRAEKIRYFRKEYERDLALAMQQSMENDAIQYAPHNTQFVRTESAGGFGLQATQQGYGQAPTPMQYPSAPGQPYTTPQHQQPYGNVYSNQQSGGYPKPTGYQQQTVGNVPLAAPATSRTNSNSNGDGETVYPSYSEQRKNHSLLGRQPSGGVV
ncbi:hypothetical protein BBJ28_00014816 [Nothophytophthora sp. Chile5]|nr:hypothetical protein BBJ28_00014816 [Nothophytophthora sp. Chile5]